jgi:hypothetical protein
VAEFIDEQIVHLTALASTLRRRQRVLEMQRAGYGPLAIPAHVVLELEDVAQQLRQVLADLRRIRSDVPTDQNPYKGLATFQEQDSAFFFGRDTLVAELLTNVSQTSFLAVMGASGSGKSSVVRAGLIPALKLNGVADSESWHYSPIVRPGTRPLDTLASAFAAVQDGHIGTSVEIRETLVHNDRTLLLTAELLNHRHGPGRLVLVIDQAEELWTLLPTDGAERAALLAEQQTFLNLLLTAAAAPDQPLLILLIMRADFLDRAIEHPDLARCISNHNVLVSPMTPEELQEVIVRPADAVGCTFEAGLVEELVKQTQGQAGALPLLEYTLDQLWDMRRSDGTLTWEAFQSLGGGVEGGLACKADTILAEQYTSDQRGELRNLLLNLIQPREDIADTRRRVRLNDLVPADSSIDAVQDLLKPLINARLLTVGRDVVSGASTVEVAHEALLRAWPTFGQWIAQARADLHFHIQLQEAAHDWQAHHESTDFLWSGLRLANAQAWRERSQLSLTAQEARFLEASQAEEQARLAAQEATRRRELEHARALVEEQRRRAEDQAAAGQRLRKRALWLAGAVIVAFAAAVAAGIFSVLMRRNATEAQQLALVSGAQAALSQGDIDQALALALTAVRVRQPTIEAEFTLAQAADTSGTRRRFEGHTLRVAGVAFSRDGQTALSGAADHTLRLWDISSGRELSVNYSCQIRTFTV